MCTFLSDSSVMVCDSIIQKMRRELNAEFGAGVSFTHVDYQGTLVEAGAEVERPRFQERVRQITEEGPDD